MANEQTSNSSDLDQRAAQEAVAAQRQDQAQGPKEAAAPLHYRVDAPGEDRSQGANSPQALVGKSLITDAELTDLRCQADHGLDRDQELRLIDEIERLRKEIQVYDLAGGEAVRQRDQYAAELRRSRVTLRSQGAPADEEDGRFCAACEKTLAWKPVGWWTTTLERKFPGLKVIHRPEYEKALADVERLRKANDELWGEIGYDEMQNLSQDTKELSRQTHERLHHS